MKNLAIGLVAVSAVLCMFSSGTVADTWMWCTNCGILFGDTCDDGYFTGDIRTGYHYIERAVCEADEDCAPCDSCTVNISGGKKTKYYLTGDISADVFGLEGGWEEEEYTDAGCEKIVNCDNGTMNAAYAYEKRSYRQKFKGYYNFTQDAWCRTCTGYGMVGTLEEAVTSVCTSTQHSDWEPELYTITIFCDECGEN